MTKILKIFILMLFISSSTNIFALQTYVDPLPKTEQNVQFSKGECPMAMKSDPPKSQIFTFLLALFLGLFGLHRIYLGYDGSGLLKLSFTLIAIIGFLMAYAGAGLGLPILIIFGGITIGWHIGDIFSILSGGLKPKNGDYVL